MQYSKPTSSNIPDTIILVNGEFPKHSLPLGIIDRWIEGNGTLICCDGAVNKLQLYTDKLPDFVIGDLDSVDESLKEKLSNRIIHVTEQETNDMTKSLLFAVNELKTKDITFLGISGGREDHFFSNISLLVEYAAVASEIIAVTDTGYLRVVRNTDSIETHKGQQISIFNFSHTPITATNLKWQVNNITFKRLSNGSLNESNGDTVSFYCENPILIYALNK